MVAFKRPYGEDDGGDKLNDNCIDIGEGVFYTAL